MSGVLPAPLAARLAKAGPPAVADIGRVACGNAIVKRRKARKGLDGGGGHKLAGDSSVHEGIGGVIARQSIPVVLRNSSNENLGPKTGRARHGNYLAVCDIYGHRSARLAARDARILALLDDSGERLLSSLLNVEVNREHDVRAGFGRDGGRVVSHVAVNVDVDGLFATNALEHFLVLVLHAGLAADIAVLIGDAS